MKTANEKASEILGHDCEALKRAERAERERDGYRAAAVILKNLVATSRRLQGLWHAAKDERIVGLMEAERDAKALRKLEAKVREMSASDLEHGIHAQFTPTTFLRWIARAVVENELEFTPVKEEKE